MTLHRHTRIVSFSNFFVIYWPHDKHIAFIFALISHKKTVSPTIEMIAKIVVTFFYLCFVIFVIKRFLILAA